MISYHWKKIIPKLAHVESVLFSRQWLPLASLHRCSVCLSKSHSTTVHRTLVDNLPEPYDTYDGPTNSKNLRFLERPYLYQSRPPRHPKRDPFHRHSGVGWHPEPPAKLRDGHSQTLSRLESGYAKVSGRGNPQNPSVLIPYFLLTPHSPSNSRNRSRNCP